MKKLQRKIAILLSIVLVMSSTLQSLALEYDVNEFKIESKIVEQLIEDLSDEKVAEELNNSSESLSDENKSYAVSESSEGMNQTADIVEEDDKNKNFVNGKHEGQEEEEEENKEIEISEINEEKILDDLENNEGFKNNEKIDIILHELKAENISTESEIVLEESSSEEQYVEDIISTSSEINTLYGKISEIDNIIAEVSTKSVANLVMDELNDLATSSNADYTVATISSICKRISDELNSKKAGIVSVKNNSIVFNDNYEFDKGLFIDEDVVLDLNNYEIKSLFFDKPLISIKNANVTIKNGSLMCQSSDKEVDANILKEYKKYVSESNNSHNIKKYNAFECDGQTCILIEQTNLCIDNLQIRAGNGSSSNSFFGGDGGNVIVGIFDNSNYKIEVLNSSLFGGDGGKGHYDEIKISHTSDPVFVNFGSIGTCDYARAGRDNDVGGGYGGATILLCGAVNSDILKIDNSKLYAGSGGESINYQNAKLPKDSNYPLTYDQRNNGIITSVKSQGSNGICNDFAHVANAETSMIKNWSKEKGLNTSYDLSEVHTAYYTTYIPADPLGNAGAASRSGDVYNNMSTNTMSISAFCSNYYGYALESVAPLNMMGQALDASTAFNTNAHMKESRYTNINGVLNQNEINSIKKSIMDYGSVVISFTISHTEEQYQCYKDGHTNVGLHAVQVIG